LGLPCFMCGEEWVVAPEQRVRGRMRTELRVGHPIVLPEPGKRLRQAVDTVLAELSEGAANPQAIHRCDDTLRTALAWTAASGDTCRVAAAVLAVRDARSLLDAKEPDRARVALLSARDGLKLPGARKPS
jgi:hypothetical protein